MKQYDDADQLGEAGTGPAPQQAPTTAGFSWSSAKPSAPPPSQQTAAQGPTTTGPTTGRFGWSPPTKVARPQQMLPPPGSTQPSAPSASAPFPHTRPAQPPPVSPNGSTAAASTIQLGYQHTQPSAHGPTAVSSSTASLLDRAKANDEQALATLFGQFISNHEQIIDSQYLGVLGMWGVGMHSFAAVTTHRIASIRISIFGRVHYQDGALEYINSSELGQPSLLGLYLCMGAFFAFFSIVCWSLPSVVAALVVLLGLLFLPIAVRLYYRFNKSGLVLWVREGISIFVFIDRKRMINAKRFYRLCCDQREERLRAIGQP